MVSKGKGAEGEGLMVRGSVYTMRYKCGKDNCHCKDGDPHEVPALSYSLKGETHLVTLRCKDIPRAKEAISRYKKAKADLEAEALAGIERLRREIHGDKGRRG
ncbi:MAG: hypothetical protein KJ792_16565 [Actinobacteria bacterium]|nr:hypothetical protein [Actinomycetota bacterium]